MHPQHPRRRPTWLATANASMFALVAALTGCGGGTEGGPVPPASDSIGGTISGLSSAGLVLANLADTVSPASGATSFSFPTAVADGTSYAVGVQQQPAGEHCTVANSTGTASGNVSSVVVSCSVPSYTVGGTLTGLGASGLTLSDGTGSVSPPSGAATFTFPTALASGSSYAVTVTSQPTGLSCTVAHASGTVANADVASVQVSCAASAPPAGQWTTSLLATSGVYPKLSSDPSGVAVFLTWTDTSLGSASSSRFTDAAGWSTPIAIPNVGGVIDQGFDAQGNGRVLYAADATHAGEAHYTPAGGWVTPGAISWGGLGWPPVSLPVGSSYASYVRPIGLVVFNDGSATARIEGRVTIDEPGKSSSTDDEYYVASVADDVHMLQLLGAGGADPLLPPSSSDDADPNFTLTSLVALIKSPSSAYYVEWYQQLQQSANGSSVTDEVTDALVMHAGGGAGSVDIVSTLASPNVQRHASSIAVSDNGSVLVAWAQIAADGQSVSTLARYYNGASWGPITVLHTASGDVSSGNSYQGWRNEPAVALDAQGNGVVAFPVFGGTMVARLHASSGSFDTAVEVATESPSTYQGAVLAALLDPSGNAYVMDTPEAVVAFPDGVTPSFRVRRLAAGASAYDTAALSANFDGLDNGYWSLVLDASGYPVVAWGAGGTLSAARYR